MIRWLAPALVGLLAALLLSSCGTPLLDNAVQTGGAKLVADLKQAQALAAAHNDTVTAPCYARLLPFAEALADPATKIGGILTAVQIQRDIANAHLDVVCGAVGVDTFLMLQKLTPGAP